MFRGRTKYVAIFAMLAVGAAIPLIVRGHASAELPADGWNSGLHASWVNTGTVQWNNTYFIDPKPTDSDFTFKYTFKTNATCNKGNGSTIGWNTWNDFQLHETSPYDNDGIASEAGLDLWIPQANSTNCTNVTDSNLQHNCDAFGTWQMDTHWGVAWVGCRLKVDNVQNKRISFFQDTDGNIKSINPNQAISFITAPNPYNGQTVYIRSDQAQAPCKNILVKIGNDWTLFAFKTGGPATWGTYYDIVKTATGAGAQAQDQCTPNDDAVLNTYFAQHENEVKQNGGGYIVYVGDVSNQGASKGAVSATPVNGGNPGGNDISDNHATCESSGFSLNWILCPVYNGTADFVQWMLTAVIQPLLQTEDFLSPTGPVFAIWSQFRIYANIFLIIAVIVVVFGQTIGTSIFEAYAVRTFLTRLLFVIILTNLSIYLMAGFFDIINVVGNGIGAVMTAPLKGAGLFKFTPSATGQAGVGIVVGGVGIAAAAAGLFTTGALGPGLLFVFLFALLPAIIGVISVVAVVVARRAFIIALVIGSPIAAAGYALPNTQKPITSRFMNATFAMGVVGIIAPGVFAISNIMSYLILKRSFGDGPFTSTLEMIEGFFFTFAPLATGALWFKWAGGILAIGHGWIAGVGKKGHESILGNPNDENSVRNKARRRFGAALTQGQKNVLDAGDKTDAGWVARQRGRFVGSGLFGNVNSRQSRYNALAAKEREQMSGTGDDTDIYNAGGFKVRNGEMMPDGTTINTGGTRYFSAKADQNTGLNKEISEVAYNRGKRYMGKNSHEVGEAMQYQLGKAQNENDKRAFRTAFGRNALEQGWSEGEMIGAYAHAAYPHKGTHASAWYSTPRYETDAVSGKQKVVFDDVADMQRGKEKGVDSSGMPVYEGLHDTDSKGRKVYATRTSSGGLGDRQVFEDKDSSGQTVFVDSGGAVVSGASKDKSGNVTVGSDSYAPVRVERADSYKNLAEDMHKSREAFKINSMNHEDAQAALVQQQAHEKRIDANQSLLDADAAAIASGGPGTLTNAERARINREKERDLKLLGETYEIFDAASQKYQTGQIDVEENVGAGGAKGATQALVVSAVQNRRYAMTQLDLTSGARTIYEPGDKTVVDPKTGLPKTIKDVSPNSVTPPSTARVFGATQTGGDIERPHVVREVERSR